VKVQRFINARESREIIFTRNATESINLVAASYADSFAPGDEIILSEIEHHSNIVPWQLLRDRRGVTLRVVPVNDAGEFLFEEYEKLLNPRTRLVAVTHTSNALGTVTPAEEIVRLAHAHGANVLFDGSQAAPHRPLDMQNLDCDFYAFTGHKLYGPSGIGVLYGKGQGRPAGGHAALPGRWRHDPLGERRTHRVRRDPAALRSGHAAYRGRDRAGRRH
jgi:cysteine desulfurase/selenocysteine lyase